MSYADELAKGFSIVIPTWNRAEYLAACLNHIRTFSTYDHEVIVISNGCTDNTMELLEPLHRLGKIKLLRSETNLGAIEATNIAATHASRPAIFLLDNDEVVLPEWDTALVDFARDNKADYTWWLNATKIEPTGNNTCCIAPRHYGTHPTNLRLATLLSDLEALRQGTDVNAICCPALISREAWETVGGICQNFESMGPGLEEGIAWPIYSQLGGRNFVAVRRCLIYHFQCQHLNISPHPRGHEDAQARNKYFKEQHGIDIVKWGYETLRRGQPWVRDNI